MISKLFPDFIDRLSQMLRLFAVFRFFRRRIPVFRRPSGFPSHSLFFPHTDHCENPSQEL